MILPVSVRLTADNRGIRPAKARSIRRLAATDQSQISHFCLGPHLGEDGAVSSNQNAVRAVVTDPRYLGRPASVCQSVH